MGYTTTKQKSRKMDKKNLYETAKHHIDKAAKNAKIH